MKSRSKYFFFFKGKNIEKVRIFKKKIKIKRRRVWWSSVEVVGVVATTKKEKKEDQAHHEKEKVGNQ